jgi:type II secretory pathway component PulF
MHMTHTEINLINGAWSLGLFLVLCGIIWYKMHRLRLEIHTLVESLPTLGSQFIKQQLADVRYDLDTTRARVMICEEKLGLNGQPGGQ